MENNLYKRDIIRIAEDRGFTPKQIEQFFNTYSDVDRYSVEMLDTFEYSVSCPVISELHPTSGKIMV